MNTNNGWKLVRVNEAFSDLMFWLERCSERGHLDNCYDLVAPWEAFKYEYADDAPLDTAPDSPKATTCTEERPCLPCYLDQGECAAPPASAQPERDWELTCDECNGDGFVYVERQVAERKSDVQEFKEECECCEGRGFTIAFEDIPGIAEYVKSCRPVPSENAIPVREKYEYAIARLGLKDSPPLRVIFWDALDALEWDSVTDWYVTPQPIAPASAQDDAKDERQEVETDSFDDPSALSAVADALADDTSNDNAQFAAAYLYKQARALIEAPAAGDAQTAAARDAKQIADLVLGHAEGLRVSSLLESGTGFGKDIEHRFQVSNGEDRYGVVIILTALAASQQQEG